MGEILGEYHETDLWPPGRPHLIAGPDFARASVEQNRAPTEPADTPIGRIGLLMCYDAAFSESFRAGFSIIKTDTKAVDKPAAARSYKVFVRGALGPPSDYESCVRDYVLCRIDFTYSGEGSMIVGVDLKVLGAAEGNYRVRRYLAREKFHCSREGVLGPNTRLEHPTSLAYCSER